MLYLIYTKPHRIVFCVVLFSIYNRINSPSMYFVTIKIFGRQNVYISKNLSLTKIRERFYLFVKQRRYVISYAFIASSTKSARPYGTVKISLK